MLISSNSSNLALKCPYQLLTPAASLPICRSQLSPWYTYLAYLGVPFYLRNLAVFCIQGKPLIFMLSSFFTVRMGVRFHTLYEFFCSIIKSYLTLCDPMRCNMPGFPFFTISWSLLKLNSIESVILSNYLISSATPFFYLQSFPALGSFPMSHLFDSGGQNIGASTSATVLPMNIQGWFPLLTGLISLLSKEATALTGWLELEESVGKSPCWRHLGRSAGVQVASVLGLEASKLYMCFFKSRVSVSYTSLVFQVISLTVF